MGQRRCSPHPLHMGLRRLAARTADLRSWGIGRESDSCDLGGPRTRPLPGTSVRA